MIWIPLNKKKLQERDYTLFLGTYRIRINPIFMPTSLIPSVVEFIKKHLPSEKVVMGKKIVLRDIWQVENHITLEITILENPLPILAILGALGFLVGGLLAWQIIIEIRKLVTLDGVIQSPVFPIILTLCVFGLGYFITTKIKGTK
jgi:hypothetical protein